MDERGKAMKLSEAIRLGAMMKPKYVSWMHSEDMTATCALGAALDACGALHSFVSADDCYERWPHLQAVSKLPCGCTLAVKNTVEAITHLNDGCGWTREQIADWVATIEPVEQSTDVVTTPASDAVDVLVDVR
jgi:hypothetical protein